MKPVIKYQGGKTKELSRIKEFAPKEFKRIVAPYVVVLLFHYNMEILVYLMILIRQLLTFTDR